MKIVVVSLSFLPSIGGLENVMAGLVHDWSISHDVHVFTKTKSVFPEMTSSYKVTRQFTLLSLFYEIIKSDIYIEANVSLFTCFAGLLNKNKWYIIHHGCYYGSFFSKLKNYVTLFTKNISCSNFVAGQLMGKSIVIPNFYNNHVFKVISFKKNSNSIVFLGRLVSDKGVDLLLHAISLIYNSNKRIRLTIIGDGEDLSFLVGLVNDLCLQNVVTFRGILKGEILANELNLHELMVIPSRWQEPFGIVALEGLASGCKIVCPDEGGLREASGPGAFIFKRNCLHSLVSAINSALYSSFVPSNDISVQSHLLNHTQNNISKKYLYYLSESIK